VWVDDPTFSLGYHLRRTALPFPGSMTQLRDLVGRLLSQHLDRSKPWWECWIVDGLPHGRCRARSTRAFRGGSAGQLLTRATGLAPPGMAAVGLTVGFRPPQRVVLAVATNVPGPQAPFIAGRRLRELYPYVPIADNVRVASHHLLRRSVVFRRYRRPRQQLGHRGLTAGIEDGIRGLVRAVDAAA
jgi:hypothetical protein